MKPLEQFDLSGPRYSKLITVATYQALHSAMNQVVGQSQIEDSDDQVEIETLISKALISFLLSKTSRGTLCLDECHHLRNEWWKVWKLFHKPSLKKIMISLI